MTESRKKKTRNLILVLGDQLDAKSAAFDDADPNRDAVLMMEVEEEATYIPQHRLRLAFFFSAMRHFAEELRSRGFTVHYVALDHPENRGSFAEEIRRRSGKTRPERLVCVHPGDFRVLEALRKTAGALGCEIDIRPDRHFLVSAEAFQAFARGRKTLLLENFYRKVRRERGVLMNGNQPVQNRWNFDRENRGAFGRKGPPRIAPPRAFDPDETTREVIGMVNRRFPDAPGQADGFDYPVTRAQALAALRDFVENRLENFGTYQDAMAAGHPYLYHSRLSCVLNVHLLDPREVIDAALEAYGGGAAPIHSTEGFVRQILGWREFVRGIYWLKMPEYAEMNALGADLPMPAFMWTGETDMNCLRQCVGQLIDHAYAHHIQRLMVMGLFALLLGVRPYEVHRWHLSMYVDAIDWVSLPNVLGMSQYGDGGIVGTKPYCASGSYIDRMSDYCGKCRYRPASAAGEDACPFTALYWDFLARNRHRLGKNPRMGLQFKNLDRKDASELRRIREAADRCRNELTRHTYL